MSTPVRPDFFEGQVLAAADLKATVEQSRAPAARHNRCQHDWGIVEGLDLKGEKRTDPVTGTAFTAITLQPGLAIDVTGREVVVADPIPLAENAFQQVNGADDVPADPALRPLYPVFLAGRDAVPDTLGSLAANCGGSGGVSRVEEAAQIIFGRDGEEVRWDDQRVPAIDLGPGNGTEPRPILVGFVTWDGIHFGDPAPVSGAVRRRYAGVRADSVIARSGQLILRPDPEVTAGRAALVLDGAGGLTFGRLTATGSISTPALMGLDRDGNLTVAGTFNPRGTPARVLVVSGTATDGIVLPLPEGVGEEQVQAGSVQIHVMLTPQLGLPPQLAPPPAGQWVPGPVDCTVDAGRRVSSTTRWYDISQLPPAPADLPTPVSFVLIATVPGTDAAGGAG